MTQRDITLCALGSVITADTQEEHRGGGAEEEEEEIYAPLGLNDEYDTILNSEAAVIANRPPAPTPRPESTQAKEDRTPYITKGNSLFSCIFVFPQEVPQHAMGGGQVVLIP